MKRASLLLAVLLIAPSIVLPPQCLLLAHAEANGFATQAHIDAIERWAMVIRRCQTVKDIHQVVGLLDEVCDQVEARRRRPYNEMFLTFLRMMHQAAILKERGLKKHDKKLLKAAEARVQLTVDWINGRVIQ